MLQCAGRGMIEFCQCNTLQHTATHCSTLSHTKRVAVCCSDWGAPVLRQRLGASIIAA